MEQKRCLESKKCQGKSPEPSTSLESIVKRDHGYPRLLCHTVINHSNKKGIKSYVKKDLINHCLLVMYAINNSNLNLSCIGMFSLIPEVQNYFSTSELLFSVFSSFLKYKL